MGLDSRNIFPEVSLSTMVNYWLLVETEWAVDHYMPIQFSDTLGEAEGKLCEEEAFSA